MYTNTDRVPGGTQTHYNHKHTIKVTFIHSDVLKHTIKVRVIESDVYKHTIKVTFKESDVLRIPEYKGSTE